MPLHRRVTVISVKKEARLEKLLCKVLMNRRHQCGSGGSLSVWITTQVYNKVPAPVRKCASQLVLYETNNVLNPTDYSHVTKDVMRTNVGAKVQSARQQIQYPSKRLRTDNQQL